MGTNRQMKILGLRANFAVLFCLLLLATLVIVIKPGHAHAAPTPDQCNKNYSNAVDAYAGSGVTPGGWDDLGYNYIVYKFEIQGQDLNAPPGTIVASNLCNTNRVDTVPAGSGGMNYKGFKPIDVIMGEPGVASRGGNPVGGYWHAGACVLQTPDDPPTQKCTNGNDYAFIDDGGEVGINAPGAPNFGTPIMCHDVNLASNPFNCKDGLPDPPNQLVGSPPHVFQGAGFLFMNDSSVKYPPNNIDNLIGRDALGYLTDFDLHILAENTLPGNFDTSIILTFKYPTVAPQINVLGRVVNNDPGLSTGIGGVLIDLCGLGTTTTRPDGFFVVPTTPGQSFCAKVASAPPPYNGGGVNVVPIAEPYLGCPPVAVCGSYSTYENQVAGGNYGNGYDTTSDSEYGFALTPAPPPQINIHGIRVDQAGVALPGDGSCGQTTVGGTTKPDNPFFFDGLTGDQTVSTSPSSVDCVNSKGGHTLYNLVGYTLCFNGGPPGCISSPINPGNSFVASGATGGTYDMRWIYQVINRPPTGSVNTPDCNFITGHATDPDAPPNTPLTIVFWVDGKDAGGDSGPGPAGTPGGNSVTTNPSQGGAFTIPIDVYKDWGSRQFYVYAYGVDSNGQADLTDVRIGIATTPNGCAMPICGNINTVPATPEPTVPFTIKAGIVYTHLSPGVGAKGRPIGHPNLLVRISLTGPGYPTQSNADSPYSPDPIPPDSNGLATYSPPTPGAAGVYTYTVTLYGPGRSPSQTCPAQTLVIANKPYLKVFGNDVAAGGTFDDGTGNCPADVNSPGKIAAWFNPSPVSAGSSVQFAALALDTIDQFGSATLRSTAAPPGPDTGLTFANAGALGTYGGSFGTTNRCISDYYGAMPVNYKNNPINVPSSQMKINPGADSQSGLYTSPGNILEFNDSQPTRIHDGQKLTIYVDHDVYIDENITYTNSSWASVDQIPSFYLIVKGNIYLDKSVEHLDGVYVAQPKNPAQPSSPANGGRIYTCVEGNTDNPHPVPTGPFVPSPTTFNDTSNGCGDHPLEVNGAFIAQQVKFYRTSGTLHDAQPGEFPDGAPHTCSVTPSPNHPNPAPLCAAEIFNFSPETYLGQPDLPAVSGQGAGKYDYVVSLPPVL